MSLIARLIEAGTPADLIEEVALLVAEKRAADARRAKDAARKREEREAEKAAASTDIHVHPGQARTSGTAEDAPSLSRPPNEINSNPPTHTHPDNNTPRTREAFPRPEWADPLVWADFLKNRAKKRLANTATAYRQLLRDIDKLSNDEWPPGRLLEAIVARGWAAAYDPREETARNDRPTRQHPPHQRSSVSEIGRELAAGYAGAGSSVAEFVPRLGSAGGNG